MTRKGIVVIVACALLAAPASATHLGFVFDANSFIQSYGTDFTTGLKATQLNARRVHSAWSSTYYNTFSDYLGAGTVQANAGNTYANWAASLGAGEGITAFNIWLLDNPAARSWGETLVTDPNGMKPVGFAPSGWNVSTDANPWGPGWLVSWWTEDLTYAINSQSTLDRFGFNADVFVDTSADGFDVTDPGAALGSSHRVWFGSYWGTQPGDWDPSHSMAFDNVGLGQPRTQLRRLPTDRWCRWEQRGLGGCVGHHNRKPDSRAR